MRNRERSRENPYDELITNKYKKMKYKKYVLLFDEIEMKKQLCNLSRAEIY